MAFVIHPRGASTVLEHVVVTASWTTRLIWQAAGNVTPANLQTLTDAVELEWAANLLPLMSNTVSFTKVTTYDLTSETGTVIEQPVDPAIVGGQTGTVVPMNVCMNVQLNTSNRGRSGRGRLKLGGLNEDALSFNNWTTPKLDDVATAINAFLNAVRANTDYEPVVASTISGGLTRAEALMQPVQSIQPRSAVGTISRRVVR